MGKEPFIDFQGKKVVVTGASSGIGRAICIELSRHNASLILLGRNIERLKETATLIESNSWQIVQLDLRDQSKILPTIKDFSRKSGRIFGLCHSAGVVETRPLNSFKIDGLRSMMDVNLVSGLELARVICRRDIIEEDGGSVLFISSIYARVGQPGQIGYSASKGAVTAAARAMAIELARKKVRVNVLSPGLVRTAMTEKALSILTERQACDIEEGHPLGIGSVQDVARAAAFLLAPQSAWITGTDLVIDGGYTAK